MGMEFEPQRNAHLALHVDDVAAARAELEAKGVEFQGETFDTGRLPHGVLPRSRRQRSHAPPPVRADDEQSDLLERYEALPLPTTKDEHWRFTDLRGLRPGRLRRSRTARRAPAAQAGLACSSSTRPGRRSSARRGIEIVRRAGGRHVRAAPRITSCSATLVGTDDKFAAQNAALWKHGLLVARARRASSSRSRSTCAFTNSAPGGALFWRLLVVAEEESRFSLIEEYVSESPEPRRLHERRPSSSSSARPRSSSTSRSRTSRARPGTSPRTAPASSATPSSTGSPAASARRRARSGSRTTSPARARPRA